MGPQALLSGASRLRTAVPIAAALLWGCVGTARHRPASAAAPEESAPPDPSCAIEDITRTDGLRTWSPTGEQYIVNKKDEEGTYQLYVGESIGEPRCITCTERPNGPAPQRHKLQPRWHPSGEWIVLAGEREGYDKPILSTGKMIEGWIQSGLWVNIYATRPDGSEWYRLSDFGVTQRGDGFTGPAFTPDGKRAVWAQIVDGNVLANLFGRWELILADFQIDRDARPSFANLRDITPAGAKWVEPGNFAPDGRSLLITADVGMSDPQGMDQFIMDVDTGSLRNLTKSTGIWDEHGVFSPDGEKILFMSSYPFRDSALRHNTIFLKTEFMLMNRDGSGLQQLTHFNSPGYPETNTRTGSVAANGEWRSDGRAISVINLFFPEYEAWTIVFAGTCGGDARPRARRASEETRVWKEALRWGLITREGLYKNGEPGGEPTGRGLDDTWGVGRYDDAGGEIR